MTVHDSDRAVLAMYEAVPYPSASQRVTHPDHLAALAILHGLDAAPPQRCRVLEIGCADGGNLIPMAFGAPESTFVGIDLSPRQIADARAFAGELQLANVDFRTLSILDADPTLGTFDFIIAHGVYSWVERNVQEKILSLCADALAPHGVAYISYNTYPGWHVRQIIRDLVLFHTRELADPQMRTAHATALIERLAAAAAGNDINDLIFRKAREKFDEHDPSYVLHEYLEVSNSPEYFHEFVARAAAHGLRYVCDAEPEPVPPIVDEIVGEDAGVLEREQMADFVANRGFRRSLLARADASGRDATAIDGLRRLFISSTVKPVSSSPNLAPGVSESFRTERTQTFSSSHPLAKGLLVMLASRWPLAPSFEEIGFELRCDDDALADLVLSLHESAVVDLHAVAPDCVAHVSERPKTTELARRQATRGLLVTNQHHRALRMDDPVARFLVTQLDGTRDRGDLLRLLDREAAERRLDVSIGGTAVVDAQRLPTVLQAVLDHHLKKMIEYALLVG